jgi:hypothetical protein
MRWRTTIVFAHVLAAVACASASNSGGPASPEPVKLDQSFTLTVGGSVAVDGEGVRVAFDRVVSDSRCPKGAQCIVAGDATVRVSLTRTSRARETRDLKTAPPDAARAVVDPYRLTLVSLEPEPTVDDAPRASDYVATLVVARVP